MTARGGVGRRAGAIIVVRGTVVVRVVVAPVGIAAGGWEKGREEGRKGGREGEREGGRTEVSHGKGFDR